MKTTTETSTATKTGFNEHAVVCAVQITLRVLLGIVPIVAGLDKFTNLLCDWTKYLNPLVLRIVPMTDHAFMYLVGVIEIIAGVVVFLKPRIGAFIVMAWLIVIALQLIVWWRFLDVAVRDLTIAIGAALTLARLSLFTDDGSRWRGESADRRNPAA
ncbi:MAG: DoxX family membrane protein [Verrucomicrobia bacterium]|nr:DoxX family membrane protein [Verrucomicrobiota bacterium]